MNKTTNPIAIGNFVGEMIVEEKLNDDGTLFCHSAYYLYNKKTNTPLAGINGDPQSMILQIQERIKSYYEDHLDEARELMQHEHDTNSLQTGVHPEPE